MQFKNATANIAGAARRQKAHPNKYRLLADVLDGVDLIGLQEVVKVYDAGGHLVRDDIGLLQASPKLRNYQSFFFPQLDSTQQSHPRKWTSPAFSQYYAAGHQVLQGSAILVRNTYPIYDLLRDDKSGRGMGQIIPWYSKSPTFYLGDRDTEPRSLLLARVRLDETRFVLFCCTHLTTRTGEKCEKGKRKPTCKARKIRKKQIKWIVAFIKSWKKARKEYQEGQGREYVPEPIILVGDFNTEPGVRELHGLKKLGLSLVPLDGKSPPYTHRTHKVWMDHIYATVVKSSDTATVVNLRDLEVDPDRHISDHHPVIATLTL